ncbi:MAG: glycosyltransferase family 4 protein [Balneolaceae bacterium]|nr:glycosyltransferase family 4 protein [Balneolaceae bacterium]
MKKLLIVVNVDWFFLSHRLPIALAAKNAGFDVVVAAADTGQAEKIRSYGLNFIDQPELESNRSILFEMKMVSKLRELYDEQKPDLVHHVTIRPVLYGSLAARLAGVPAVVNALSGLGYLYTHNTLKNRLLRLIIYRLYKIGFNHPNLKLILQNRDDLNLFVEKNLIPKDKIKLIKGVGVDISKFRPSSTHNNKVKVALIGRMLWDKGVEEFINAGEELHTKGLDFEFHLFGEPYEKNPMSIPNDQLAKWGKIEWLTYHGHVDDISAILEEIDIVCLPSYREGMPKALLEAAASGKPIVTTDVPGCREVVDDGINGYLVPSRNSIILAEKIEHLIENEEVRNKFGKASRKKAETEFALEIINTQMLSLYDELMLSSE